MTTLQDYFDAGFDPIGLMPESKDTREAGWNDATRPRSATPYHENGNVGLRTGVPGTAPNGQQLYDSDRDAPEVARIAHLFFPASGAVTGRRGKPSSHAFYVDDDCGLVPHIKLDGLGGDDDTIIELRTRTKSGKALQTVVPSSVWKSKLDGHVEDVVLETATFSPAKFAVLDAARASYLCATSVLLSRVVPASGHDYRLDLCGWLYTLGLNVREVSLVGEGVMLLTGGNQTDWDAVCRSTNQKALAHQPYACDLGKHVPAEVLRHIRKWFGVKERHQRTLSFQGADMIEPQVTDWLWDEYIPLGAFGLHSGREGLGKSATAFEIAARITRGELAGCFFGTPKRVVICATEDDWATTIVPRLMAANADLTRIMRVEVTAGDSTQELLLPTDLDAFQQGILSFGDVALVLLDPLMSRLDGRLDTHKDSQVRQALEPLVRLAQDAHVTVLGIIHVNKTQTNDPLTAIMGSRAFVAVARFVFATVQDPNDEAQFLLGQVKCNVGAAKRDTHAYTLESTTVGQDARSRDIKAPRVKWLTTSPRSIRSYFEEAQDKATAAKKADSLSDVQVWLSDYLAKQPGQKARSMTVIADGASAGYSERKVRKAAVLIKVEVTTTKTFPSTTEWALVSTSRPVTF